MCHSVGSPGAQHSVHRAQGGVGLGGGFLMNVRWVRRGDAGGSKVQGLLAQTPGCPVAACSPKPLHLIGPVPTIDNGVCPTHDPTHFLPGQMGKVVKRI